MEKKSRDKFIREGDRNTKFFHATTQYRRHKNNISQLKQPDGTWMHKRQDIVMALTDFFQNIISERVDTSPIPPGLIEPIISDPDNATLISLPTLGEIWNALESIGSLKSSGLDGFPSLFYKHSWDQFHHTIEDMITHFFHNIHNLSHINHTNLAFIPKCPNPTLPNHFCPISLCIVSYKIISKLLAKRLKPLLPKIISPMQFAFVAQRQITNNIIISH